MKKLTPLSLLIFLSLSLTACGSDSWQQDVSYLKPEQIEKSNLAIKENLEKIAETPELVDAYFQLGFHYQALGQYKKAEEYYNLTIELDPAFTTPYNNLAVIYEEVGEYKKAAVVIKELYQLNPLNRTEVLSDAVRIYLKNDDPDSAQAILQDFNQSLNPEDKPKYQPLVSDLYDKVFNYRQKNEK
ncbi:tetratricopeptide repeat protein [Candidatus Gracilibacteria bacterium]|nr:tetratricopeptide repeat protein [Candidatus Gracilibacteria bacterium]